MILIDIKNQLWRHFLKREIFSEEDIAKIDFISDKGPEFKRNLILAALSQLEKQDVIVKVEESKKKMFWVLARPLDKITQVIEIPPAESQYVAEILNDVNSIMGVGATVDASNLNLEDFLIMFDTIKMVLLGAKKNVEGLNGPAKL